MQQIFISDKILKIQKDYCANLFSKRNKSFELPSSKLEALRNKISSNLHAGVNPAINWPNYLDYVDEIIKHYDAILALKPSQFDYFHRIHFSFLTEAELDAKIFGTKETFYAMIVNAMRYDAVRDREFAQYIRQLGIKSCVYCNSQYTVPTHGKGQNKNDVTTYEIDHYYPKSQYPYLCTTFFNLVPSCGPCNRRKNDKKVTFCLYTDALPGLQQFHFNISKASVTRYLVSRNPTDIKFTISHSIPGLSDSLSTFHLQDIYNEHTDIAEELIWKHGIYKKAYRDLLKFQFGSLIKSDDEVYRLLFGVYPITDSIHKRPLSLFVNEIRKDLANLFPITY